MRIGIMVAVGDDRFLTILTPQTVTVGLTTLEVDRQFFLAVNR
jgi:hypothetical protein